MDNSSTSTFTSSDIIALASAVTALCALGTSLWQGFLTRKHNVLSVRPHIEVTLRARHDLVFALELINNGLGPAFISKLQVKLDGRTYPLSSETSYDRFVQDLLQEDAQVSVEYHVPDAESSIGAGSTLRVLAVHPTGSEAQIAATTASLQSVARKLSAQATYSCIYGKPYTSSSGSGAA